MLATGVILCSLFISNFILPRVVRKPISTGQDNKEDKAYLDILDNVVAALEKTLNQHNQVAVRMVLSQYQSRIRSLQTKLATGHIDRKKEKEYSIRAWK